MRINFVISVLLICTLQIVDRQIPRHKFHLASEKTGEVWAVTKQIPKCLIG